MKKFKLTKEAKIVFGIKLFRIQALISFNDVIKGELGGWLEKEENLSQFGDAWVSGDARVSGRARVSGDAWISGRARVSGDAWISGDAWVSNKEMYWHIHHEILAEPLTEPLKNRKDYIKSNKSKDEVKLRLKLLRKVKAKIKDYPTSKSGWEKLHKIECGCDWNKKTIFTKKNGLVK